MLQDKPAILGKITLVIELFNLFRKKNIFSWLKFENTRFQHWTSQYEQLKNTNPLLEDFIHSGLDEGNFYKTDLYEKEKTSTYECAQLCLQQSSCDMFLIQGDINKCLFYPHISLKDKPWGRFIISDMAPIYDNHVYVLQCALASENVLSPDPLMINNFDRWNFEGKDLQAKGFGSIEEKFQLLSSNVHRLEASQSLAISVTIQEGDLPLGINNEFLTIFPQVIFIMLRVNFLDLLNFCI